MKILFDTNVVLDLLLDREPFSTMAARIFSKIETGDIRAYICATTITTVHYLASKAVGADSAKEQIRKLLVLFEIAPVNRSILEAALAGRFTDFEDAVVYEAALHVGVEGIVTRDTPGFKRAKIPVYSPDELSKILQARDDASR